MMQTDKQQGQKEQAPGEAPALFPLGDELTVDELMTRVRAEVHRRRSIDQEPLAEQDGDIRRQKRLPRWTTAAGRLPVKSAYELNDLLQFSDEEFVATAYRVLLRRRADVDGLGHYLEALRHGFLSKVQVLGEIRFSEEGRRNDVHVNGLLLPYKIHGWRRIPLIGKVLGFAMALARLPQLSMHLQAMESSAGRSTQDIGHLINRLDDDLEERFDAFEEDLQDKARLAVVHSIEAQVNKTESELVQLRSEVQRLQEHFNATADEQARIEAGLEKLGALELADVATLQKSANENRRGLLDLQRKVMSLSQRNMVSSVDAANPGEVAVTAGSSLVLEAEYVSFEDTFRGEREDIKRRSEHYLVALTRAAITPDVGLILDLGCGRGEWLELLQDRGYTARGIDLNPVMLEDSREHGLDVVQADAIAYLAALPEGSVAAITSMHLVEHLPYESMIRLIDEARRVLLPGGLLALETPNPENITVGSCWFYLDPTHRNPIPPGLLQWVVSNRGFDAVEIHRLSEHRGVPDLAHVAPDVPGAAQINEMITWFTNAPDYAVFARKS